MYSAVGGYIDILSRQWEHDPTPKDNDGWTVAMIAAQHGYIDKLSSQWEHDPIIKDNYGWTVFMIAAKWDFTVPE